MKFLLYLNTAFYDWVIKTLLKKKIELFGVVEMFNLAFCLSFSWCHSSMWLQQFFDQFQSLVNLVTQSLGHSVTWSLGHLVTPSLVTRSLNHACDGSDWATEWLSDRVTKWPRHNLSSSPSICIFKDNWYFIILYKKVTGFIIYALFRWILLL